MAEEKKVSLPLPKVFADWQVGDKYEIVKQIGSGSYGMVCEAKNKFTGETVAIKKVNRIFDDVIDSKRILREISLLRYLKHINIVGVIEIVEPNNLDTFDSLYLVMEYAQSDIKKMVKSEIFLDHIHIKTLLYNTLCGLKYIHSMDILHRDLKPANILINEDCSVKICDFGLARSVVGIESAKRKPNNGNTSGNSSSDNETEENGSERQSQVKFSEDTKQRKLVKTKATKKAVKRELTGHVVTRWYRAPELILIEKEYNSSIDIWSVGCIFAELLYMIKENSPNYKDRKPLFPGSSCFPLSPDPDVLSKKKGFPSSSKDQLNMIFNILGTPDERDLTFVTDDKALEYLRSFPPRPKKNLQEMFPVAGSDAISLLTLMVQLNPHNRSSLEECLNHPYLTEVKDSTRETIGDLPAIFPFEKEANLGISRLRELFIEEICKYKAR